MFYNYYCNNEIINVFVWPDNYHNEVTIHDNKTNKSFERTIREDISGKFFTWNKNKIYINDWIKTSMKDFKEKLKNNNTITSDDFCQAILSEDINNIKFLIPNLDNIYTLFKINEIYNREIKQNYKIHLISIETDNISKSEMDFTTNDMLTLIKNGIIKIII